MFCSSVPQAVRVAVFVAALYAPAFAQSLAPAAPETIGMSSQRLERLTNVMNTYAREEQIAGGVTLLARGGRLVYFKPSGFLDIEKNIRMPKDAIFRIASMSKAITTVGAMILVEEGKLLLTDRVGKYIPAFEKTSVMGIAMSPVAAQRAITIRDLMTHTSGISYGGSDLEKTYNDAGFTQWYFADRREPIGEWIEKLATLPFEAQPGSRYVYGYTRAFCRCCSMAASSMACAF